MKNSVQPDLALQELVDNARKAINTSTSKSLLMARVNQMRGAVRTYLSEEIEEKNKSL